MNYFFASYCVFLIALFSLAITTKSVQYRILFSYFSISLFMITGHYYIGFVVLLCMGLFTYQARKDFENQLSNPIKNLSAIFVFLVLVPIFTLISVNSSFQFVYKSNTVAIMARPKILIESVTSSLGKAILEEYAMLFILTILIITVYTIEFTKTNEKKKS